MSEREGPPGRMQGEWGDETYLSASEAFATGAVAILPIGATEPHGPHLPVSTDVVIAEEMARRGAERLERRGVRCLIMPAIAYSIAEWSEGFAGRISLSAETAKALVREVCLGSHAAGARLTVLANAHLEPAHVACLREACREAGRASGSEPIFPDVTRRKLAERLGEAFRSGDHAGAYETSLLMAVRPELVREEARRSLPAVEGSLVEKIQKGARSFREAGMTRAYCGDPASASTREGERLFDELAGVLEEAVLEALARE